MARQEWKCVLIFGPAKSGDGRRGNESFERHVRFWQVVLGTYGRVAVRNAVGRGGIVTNGMLSAGRSGSITSG